MCSKLTINDAIRQLTTTIKMMMYLLEHRYGVVIENLKHP